MKEAADSEFLNTVRHHNAERFSNPRDKLCCTNEDATEGALLGAAIWRGVLLLGWGDGQHSPTSISS